MSKDSNQSHASLHKIKYDFTAGLVTGVTCAGLFNPYDKGLYLSVKFNRSFLRAENFKAPFQGLGQAIFQRTYTGGLYFIAQSEIKQSLLPAINNHYAMKSVLANFIVGTSAGVITAVMSNGLAAVKYQTWGKDNRKVLPSVMKMYNEGGLKPFFKGTTSTLARDISFGGTYEVLRHMLRENINATANHHFLFDFTAAFIATVVSATFNYTRNMQYASNPSKPSPSINSLCVSLYRDTKQFSGLHRYHFLQRKLRIGWGTLRVGMGMAVGQWLFENSRSCLESLDNDMQRANIRR